MTSDGSGDAQGRVQRARAVGAERAHKVLDVVLSAETRERGVAGLAELLDVDEATAAQVFEGWADSAVSH